MMDLRSVRFAYHPKIRGLSFLHTSAGGVQKFLGPGSDQIRCAEGYRSWAKFEIRGVAVKVGGKRLSQSFEI